MAALERAKAGAAGDDGHSTDEEVEGRMSRVHRGSISHYFKDPSEMESRYDTHRGMRGEFKEIIGIRRRSVVDGVDHSTSSADGAVSGETRLRKAGGETAQAAAGEGNSNGCGAHGSQGGDGEEGAQRDATTDENTCSLDTPCAESRGLASESGLKVGRERSGSEDEGSGGSEGDSDADDAIHSRRMPTKHEITSCTCGFLRPSFVLSAADETGGNVKDLVAELQLEVAEARAELVAEKELRLEEEKKRMELEEILIQTKLELASLQEELVKNNNVLHRSVVDRHELASQVDDLKARQKELRAKKKRFSLFRS
eukprot:Rmarinus@m.7024